MIGTRLVFKSRSNTQLHSHNKQVDKEEQNRSTEGCSKLKSPETRQVQEIGLDIRTQASPKVGQGKVSGGVSVLC